MARIFVNHPVADYEKWRPHFDADAPRRSSAGLKDIAVLRDVDDPSSVWIVFEGDASAADKMLTDPDLAKVMKEAGVTGAPQSWAT